MATFKRIDWDRFTTLRLVTAVNNLPDNYYELDGMVQSYLDEDERDEVIEYMKAYVEFAKLTFKKAKFVLTLETAHSNSYSKESYRTVSKKKADNVPDPQGMFSIAFDLAAIIYMLRNTKTGLLDLATFTMMYQRDSFVDWWGADKITSTDFKVRAKAMVDNLVGKEAKQSFSYMVTQGTNTLRSLVLPQMDSALVNLHHDIYNAMKDENVATFNALMEY